MLKLKMENYNLILAEMQKKYQHFHRAKLINMNILREVMLSNQSRIKEKVRFTYSPLEKASEKKQNKTKQMKTKE